MTHPSEPAARESLDHLQAAARELIAAARSALDAAERLIDDPETMATLASGAGRLGDLFRSLVPDRSSVFGPGDGQGGDDTIAPGDTPIERITLG